MNFTWMRRHKYDTRKNKKKFLNYIIWLENIQ